MREAHSSANAAVFVTSHFHSPLARKTDIHFLAEALSRRGWTTNIVTVGQSLAKQLLRPSIARLARSVRPADAQQPVGGYVARELIHPLSGAAAWLELASAPLLVSYGRSLDRRLHNLVERADLVVIEAGYPSLYHAALSRAAPGARFACFLNDDLAVVGFRRAVVARALAAMPKFHLVRVPAQALLGYLPDGCRAVLIPHGVEKHLFDQSWRSPYRRGRRNVVSVGNMLFEAEVVRAMAQHRPDVDFHVIGAHLADPLPANIIRHGELAFERAVPFIKFADAGLAPYRRHAGASYLADSSMKLLQYSYCGLPLLLPDHLPTRQRRAFSYAPSDRSSIGRALDRALGCGGAPVAAADILDWSEIAERILEEAFYPCNRQRSPRTASLMQPST